MSKSSQRKRSMFQLGKQHGDYYRYPWYPKSKDYMRGWNKTYTRVISYEQWRAEERKLTMLRRLIFSVALIVTIYIGSLVI